MNRIELENLREVALTAYDLATEASQKYPANSTDRARAEADAEKAQWAINFLNDLLGE